MKTTVRLVKRGEQHPYVIEVMTPGWCGVDAAFEEGGKGVWAGAPQDLKQIFAILEEAKVKPHMTVLVADGATEFILKDSTDFRLAIEALVLARWLSPEHRTVASRLSC